MSSDPQLVKILEESRDDFPAFAESFLRIRTRDQQIKPLKLNRPQLITHKILEKQRREKGFVQAIILKARRLGMSTYIEGRYYHRATLWPQQHVYIVAHRDDSCEVLFQMAKLFQRENVLKPPTEASNRKELRFRGVGSEYGFASADSPDAARSRDLNLLHGSEIGFWRDSERILTALMDCIPAPSQGYSETILESTANGYGNLFQRLVFDVYAEGRFPYYQQDGYTYAYHNPEPDESGNTRDWILLFFPWFSLPANTMPFDTEQAKIDFQRRLEVPVYRKELGRSAPSEERELQVKYDLTAEQLNWRRWTIANKHNGNVTLFKQENPATVTEAFISSGGNVFAAELCDELEKLCQPPSHEGTLVTRHGKVVSRRMQGGPLRIWEAPKPSCAYLVTVDPAGGLRELQSDKNDPDYTCMDVWRRDGRYLVQVAQWHGHLDYDLIGDEAMQLATLYGKATIAVLRMNHGLTVLAKLRDENWPYIATDEDGKQGILETRSSKRTFVDQLVEYARDGWLHLASTETVSEMRTFVERNGKLGAEDGCKDDRVSSAYCAVHMHIRLPWVEDNPRHQRSGHGNVRIVNASRIGRKKERPWREPVTIAV